MQGLFLKRAKRARLIWYNLEFTNNFTHKARKTYQQSYQHSYPHGARRTAILSWRQLPLLKKCKN